MNHLLHVWQLSLQGASERLNVRQNMCQATICVSPTLSLYERQWVWPGSVRHAAQPGDTVEHCQLLNMLLIQFSAHFDWTCWRPYAAA
jgi:hypothetical protein